VPAGACWYSPVVKSSNMCLCVVVVVCVWGGGAVIPYSGTHGAELASWSTVLPALRQFAAFIANRNLGKMSMLCCAVVQD
jgi:hypothetical protein